MKELFFVIFGEDFIIFLVLLIYNVGFTVKIFVSASFWILSIVISVHSCITVLYSG